MTNTNIQQNNEKIKRTQCFQNLELGGGVLKYTAIEILLGSNELAADILAANGFFVDKGDKFADYDDVWKFYGVSETYFSGTMQRNWISSRGTPEDIHRTVRGTIRISARMILALSVLMYAGRNIPADSKVKQVFKRLEGTRYYQKASEKAKADAYVRACKEDKRTAAQHLVETALSDEVAAFEITREGKILISIAGLAKFVQAMSGTSVAYRASEASETQEEKKAGQRTFASCKPVVISKNGKTKKFDSIRECATYIGCHVSSVSRVLGNKNHTVHGYTIMPA